jgi:hypothetical protein
VLRLATLVRGELYHLQKTLDKKELLLMSSIPHTREKNIPT